MAHYDFDLIVVGGGAAGLTASGIAANAGVKTMMVERERLGGDCTWTGCVPSKALLHSAALAHAARTAGEAGIQTGEVTVDFEAVMDRVHRLREEVYEDADKPSIYEDYGIEVVHGEARFTDPHTLRIEAEGGSRTVTSRMFILATGGRPVMPPIEGLDAVPTVTNETLFEIERLPERLIVVGGGPIGVEMAQAFRRLGSEVTVVDRGERILSKDDPEHSAMLQHALEREGIRFMLEASVERAARHTNGTADLFVEQGGQEHKLSGDLVLVAVGRRPNVENLGLEEVGVDVENKGIVVDDRCRTSQDHIWAAGDCTGEYQLTHMSEHMAKVAATNAVLKVPSSIDRAGVPWCTYTAPEMAQVGKTEHELYEAGEDFEVYRFPYTKIDRAITEDATTGQIKVFATKWRGTILGASIVGERAGELASLYAVAIKGGVSLREVSDTIMPYPTYALGARRAADQWYVQKQYPKAVQLLQTVFQYRGSVPPPPDPDRIV